MAATDGANSSNPSPTSKSGGVATASASKSNNQPGVYVETPRWKGRRVKRFKLIDELGLKGTRVGGAMVSLQHGNFLVNDGNATARDVLDLIELVRARAKRERDIDLQTEVEIIGE